MANLEDTLRDLAKRGEISHISLVPSQNGKAWRGSFAMCSHFGVSFAEDADPVKAVLLACTTAKLKKPRAKIDVKPERAQEARMNAVEVEAGIRKPGDVDVEDLM